MAKLTDLIRPAVRERALVGLTGGGSTKLDGIVTVGVALSPVPFVQFSVGGVFRYYILRAGTDAESSPNIIRPDDYAGGTNEKVWQLVSISGAVAFPVLAPDGSAPIPYSFALNGATGIWHDITAPESLNVTINGSDVVSIIDAQMLLVDGDAAAPAYSFNAGSDAGMYYDSGDFSLNFANGGSDVLKLKTLEARIGAGVGLAVTANANAIAGNAVLVAGTVTITNTNVATGAVIQLTRKTAGGVIGDLTYTIGGGGGAFTINSSNVADTSTVSYLIVNVN